MSDHILLKFGYKLDTMPFIKIKLIIKKNMNKYFVFQISNKIKKKITNGVNLFSKNNFLIINYNFLIIIYKLYILIF